MTTTLIILGVLAAFVVYIIISYKRSQNMPDTPNSPKIKMLNNKNFKLQIKSGITLVDFWAPWCGPCKMMAPVLNDLAESIGEGATVGKVNVDHHQPLANKYKIRNIPTLVMYKDGKELNRYVGVKTKKFLIKEIERNR
jgi:thioredoxin 1